MVCQIELLKKGDKAEFEKIYTGLFGMLYALGYQYVQERTIAEGMVQEAFIKLWEIREKLESHTNVRNFLYTVTRNLCLNYLRDQKVIWKHLDLVKSEEYDYAIRSLQLLGGDIMEYEELKLRVDQAIENLPEKVRTVFKMSRFGEMKYSEIAGQLQIGEKAVEARMTKALRILRLELKDYLNILFLLP